MRRLAARAPAPGLRVTKPVAAPSAIRCRSGPTARPARPPDLDQRVGHGLAVAVEHAARDRDGARPSRATSSVLIGRAQADREERPDRLRRRRAGSSAHSSIGVAVAAAEHDVEAVAERPLRHRSSPSRTRETSRSRAAGSRTTGRSGRTANSGSPGKYICVTSRSRERAAEEREVDVRRPPGVGVVPPRVGAGLDRDEPVPALGVGEAAAGAGEVRVERRRVLVALVEVAAGGVRLPDLDQRVAAPAGRPSSTRPRDDDALAQRLAVVLAGEVGVGLGHAARRRRPARSGPRAPRAAGPAAAPAPAGARRAVVRGRGSGGSTPPSRHRRSSTPLSRHAAHPPLLPSTVLQRAQRLELRRASAASPVRRARGDPQRPSGRPAHLLRRHAGVERA